MLGLPLVQRRSSPPRRFPHTRRPRREPDHRRGELLRTRRQPVAWLRRSTPRSEYRWRRWLTPLGNEANAHDLEMAGFDGDHARAGGVTSWLPIDAHGDADAVR